MVKADSSNSNAITTPGIGRATASMTVNFQGAVRAGLVNATGTVERTGKRLVFTRAQIFGEADRVMAAATAVMTVLPDVPAGG